MKKIIELRASNAHRWMVCHGQPQAVANIKDTGSEAADRGTVAHALMELMLRLDIPTDEIDRYAGKPLLRKIEDRRADHILVDDDMMDGVSHAIEYVRKYLAKHPKADYEPECPLDATSLVGYDSGGTGDIIIHDLPREVVIVDYKNGIGHVEHVDNEQLHIYGLGVIAKFADQITPRTKFRLVIIQPNTRENVAAVRETVVSYDDLLIFGQKAAAAAKEAHRKNPRRVAGDHCNFCKAAGSCKTFADATLHAAALEFANIDQHVMDHLNDAESMSDEELNRILVASKMLYRWLANVEEEAIRRMLNDRPVGEFKLVASRTHRKWTDDNTVIGIIQRIAPQRMQELAPPTPISPALMERRLSHKADGDPKLLHALTKAVTRNPSSPKIGAPDDSRPLYKPGSEFK